MVLQVSLLVWVSFVFSLTPSPLYPFLKCQVLSCAAFSYSDLPFFLALYHASVLQIFLHLNPPTSLQVLATLISMLSLIHISTNFVTGFVWLHICHLYSSQCDQGVCPMMALPCLKLLLWQIKFRAPLADLSSLALHLVPSLGFGFWKIHSSA